jgi:pilus assembly protein CpaB
MNRTRIIGIVLALVLALGGAFVLTGYVSTADSRALAGTKLVPVYVAKQTIPANTAGDDVQRYLAVKQLPAVAALPGLVTDLASLKGLKANAAIEQGEQLISARWSKTVQGTSSTFDMRPDMEAITVALPIEQALGGQLKAGDTVGVLVASEKAAPAQATQKLHNVVVLKVQPGDTMSSSPSTASSGAATVDKEMVTLAVETDGAAQVVWGQQFGTIWLTLEQKTTDHAGDPTATGGTCKSNCSPVYGGKAIDASN